MILCLTILALPMLFCGKHDSQTTKYITGKVLYSGVDELGTRLQLTEYPQRIISLAPSNTEILFFLGAGDRVAGRTRYCNYPEETGNIPVISGFIDINIERILSLEPDLVLAVRGNPEKILKQLQKLNLPVFALDPLDITDVVETITTIGKITGNTKEAHALTNDLSIRIKRITTRVNSIPDNLKPKVFYGDWRPPISTAGINNPIDSLITMAGGTNIARDAGVSWPKYSFERVLAHNPDIIINGFKNKNDLEKEYKQIRVEMKNDPLWSKIKAVKTNKVFFINEDIVMRPGPRMVDALETFAQYLHPQLFISDQTNAEEIIE